MLNKFSSKEIFIVLIALIPVIYLVYAYPSLPEIVPTHFNFSGKADGYGNKSTLIFTTSLLIAVALGSYLLIKFLPKIDPKKTAKLSSGAFQKIAVSVVILLSALNMLIIYASVSGSFNMGKLFNPLTGVFFIYIGNLMHNIKPNYFVGIRVPWTLEDADNWRATHQFGSKLWVAGGILIICTLLLPAKAAEIAFMSIITLLVLIPICYSFIYFKKHQQQQ
jgi:immunity protein, SdpI family